MLSLNLDSNMNKERIQFQIDIIRQHLDALESEVKSNPSGYLAGVSYEDVLEYYDTNDDDGEEGL